MGEKLRETPASCPRGSRVGPPQLQDLFRAGGALKGTGDPRAQPFTSSCHSSDAQAWLHHEPPKQGSLTHPNPAHLNILLLCLPDPNQPSSTSPVAQEPWKEQPQPGKRSAAPPPVHDQISHFSLLTNQPQPPVVQSFWCKICNSGYREKNRSF